MAVIERAEFEGPGHDCAGACHRSGPYDDSSCNGAHAAESQNQASSANAATGHEACDHDHLQQGRPHSNGALGHSHLSHADTAQKLAFSLGLTLLILAAEVIGGIRSGSLALLSDAAHMCTDVLALALAWYAQLQSMRPANHRRTYGFHRAGIMAGMVNAVTLMVVSTYIVWEAIQRLRAPEHAISAPIMTGVAAVALVANLIIARMLSGGSHSNLNVRSALLHVLGDAAASAGVIIGGVIITMQPRWSQIDALLSLVIATVIVVGAWRVLQEVVNVLMEGTPTGVNMPELEESLTRIPGVRQVHHVHVWALSSGLHALSGHVVIEDQAVSETAAILHEIHEMLKERFGVLHSTIQFECSECGVICTLANSAAA